MHTVNVNEKECVSIILLKITETECWIHLDGTERNIYKCITKDISESEFQMNPWPLTGVTGSILHPLNYNMQSTSQCQSGQLQIDNYNNSIKLIIIVIK